eukprot:g12392.t1
MPENPILSRMLDRLYASLVRGPSLNARPHNSRQRIDLTLLARLDDKPGSEALSALLGEPRRITLEAKVPMPDGYRPARWGGVSKVKPEPVEPEPIKPEECEPASDEVPTPGETDCLSEEVTLTEGVTQAEQAEQDGPADESPATADDIAAGEPTVPEPSAQAESEIESTEAAEEPGGFEEPDEEPDEETEEEPGDESEPEAVRRYNAQKSLLNKLRNLSDDARTYEQDTGVSVLAVGYPMLSLPPGTIGGGSKRILAPIAMVPVDLSVRSGARPGVTLSCREDGVDRVQPNAALMAWLERETQQALPEDLFADDEGEQPLVEIGVLIDAVTKMLNLSGVDTQALIAETFSQLEAVPRTDGLPGGPAVLPGAVMGLYPVSNQGLMRDMRGLIAEPSVDGPIKPFIDSSASLAVNEHDTPEAEATVQKQTRCFEDERFIAMADPCQARTVRLAHEETGLVIHGPPGTGKSQTITNIIGDFLARGQRVLFVCDKRTALDVVYNRLEHLGLGRLCALVHDPQRDQRDLYMGIRGRLEELTDFKTAARAERSVKKIDDELQVIHDEMLGVHRALMSESEAELSFHEQVGRWLSLEVPAVDGLSDALGDTVTPEEIDASRAEIEVILRRGEAVDLPNNPWFGGVGVSLEAYLSRAPDEMRRQLAGCVEDTRALDSTAHENIPGFDAQAPLDEQAKQRAQLLESLAWIDAEGDEALCGQVEGWDAQMVAKKAREVEDVYPTLTVLEEKPLDRDLWMLVRDDPPRMRELVQQIGTLDAYLDACRSLLGFLRFSHKKEGKAVLRSYGLSTDAESAEKLKGLLVGLRGRWVLSELLLDLRKHDAEEKPTLLADDDLRSGIELYRRTLAPTRLADTQPALAEPWRRALRGAEARQRLIDGLKRSPARSEALQRVESTLRGIGLFSEAWLGSVSAATRAGKRLSAVVTSLDERFDDLENVLRVRDGIASLPNGLAGPVRVLAEAGLGEEQGVAVLLRGVLGRTLRRRVAADEALRGLDPERIERHIDRYLELEHSKRGYVIKSILHRWTQTQRDRLLVGTGTRLNSEGASMRNRLFVRGKRAMRLRQVISVGQDIEGGDPLFDMCPVWMASPETVAQVFPREPIFDVVIFDEASQCRLEEALPVLTRGKRVVIAGDPKQLPPTRFFESAVASSEDTPIEDEQDVFEAQLSEVEDLLAAALNLEVQESYLDVHYRSQNADLIGFSNEQFYHGRLQPIPGHPRNITSTPPIAMHRVNGVYEERANPDEARYIVSLVGELLEQDRPPSIGIATFNLVQRDLIAELLDEAAASDSAFGKRLAKARERRSEGSFEGLFIKNLENVQGDERDHIIISTTYGPNSEGRFYRRFGPLRQAGGGRRLNVLVTRARRQVHLVTSIPRTEYAAAAPIPEGVTPNGAWLLFAYLRYAEQLEGMYDQELKRDPETAPNHLVPGNEVAVWPIEPTSDFALALAKRLAGEQGLGSTAHWGNEGFCLDAALSDERGPGGVTLGVMTDFNRFRYATDPVAWEAYRTAIFRSQGWDLHRKASKSTRVTTEPAHDSPTDIALYCPSCMYDLRGLTSDVCPECGAKIDRARLEKSSIPWVHREGLGIGAFWKTVVFATFKTEYFSMEIARPVSLNDARQFRRRVVWLLTLVGSVYAGLLALMVEDFRDSIHLTWAIQPSVTVLFGLMGVGLVWLFLTGWTGLHMYWFHPKALPVEQQNRAVALSHYACAPLMGFVLSAAAIGVAILSGLAADRFRIDGLYWVSLAFGIPGGISVILTVAAFLFVCARMAQHTSHRTGLTRLMLWLVLPLTWLLWGGLVFCVLPVAGLYVYMMINTM